MVGTDLIRRLTKSALTCLLVIHSDKRLTAFPVLPEISPSGDIVITSSSSLYKKAILLTKSKNIFLVFLGISPVYSFDSIIVVQCLLKLISTDYKLNDRYLRTIYEVFSEGF